jgi:hypothetical protein
MNQFLVLICLCVVSYSDAVPSKFSGMYEVINTIHVDRARNSGAEKYDIESSMVFLRT